MKLSQLSKPQWDAAMRAGCALLHGSPDRDEDRRAYADATLALMDVLPEDLEVVKALVREAARWEMKNTISETIGAHG